MKKLLCTLLAASALLSGCAMQTAYVNGTGGRLSYEDSQAFFIAGIGQEKTVDAVQVCGGEQNITKVESHLDGVNVLWGLVTLGIYTPRTARVYCR
jgi:hypothetical protein